MQGFPLEFRTLVEGPVQALPPQPVAKRAVAVVGLLDFKGTPQLRDQPKQLSAQSFKLKLAHE